MGICIFNFNLVNCYILLAILISYNNRIQCVGSTPLGKNEAQRHGLFDGPEVFLTIQAIPGIGVGGGINVGGADTAAEFQDKDRQLELNWYNLPSTTMELGFRSIGWIGLFSYDPSSTSVGSNGNGNNGTDSRDHYDNALFKIILSGNSDGSGSVNSSIKFQRIEYNVSKYDSVSTNVRNGDEGICLGFWIAYFTGNESQSQSQFPSLTNCLKVYPTWMNDLKEIIGDRPLSSLMIPGTHNSGAWKYYEGPSDMNALVQYTYNQEDPIYSQLQYGIRYLDIRVGYQPATDEKFWIYHSLIRIRPLSTLLTDVKRFVQETNEIVFMDFHRVVEGFGGGQSVHGELVEFVTARLGDILVSKRVVGLNPTANQVWNSGKNVIWSYADGFTSSLYDHIWPYLTHAWGDKNDVDELRQYLESRALPNYGCQGSFWSAMASLTPTTRDIFLRPLFGLRRYAQLVNIPMTNWYRNANWYSRSNIISTDFYLGNNIIEMSVKVNKNRGSCP